MCGITGAVALDGRSPVNGAALDAMCQTMVHRGPDSAGAVVMDVAGLAMRRLSIIDVAGGQQPLSSEDGEIQLVCNGEIYNFRELRRDLEAAGPRFATHSDSEVAVHGRQRLVSAGEVDDREPPHADAACPREVESLVVGAAVHRHLRHGLQRRAVDRTTV